MEYRVAWAPVGEGFRAASDSDWNVFTASVQVTLSGLEPGGSYQVKVRALFDGRRSRWSNTVTVEAAVPGTGADAAAAGSGRSAGGSLASGLVRTLTDTPAVTGPAAVDFAENSEDAVATYVAANLANDPVVWSVSGDDGAAFAIAGGVLEFVAVPDYEKPSDADADNVYAVTVTATDALTMTASVNAAVTVTDVNDPSIVVIMADDAGDEVFGAYGSTQYDTPRLDAIAASGVRFDNAFSKPVCTPSRVAIMTGNSNVRNYADWSTLLDDQYTFGDLFSDAGYATAIAGKWQLQGTGKQGRPHTGSSAGRGFDTYCLWHTTLTNGNDTSKYWGPAVECDGSLIETESTDYGPDIFVDFLLDFIETNQSRPFFAYYPMVLPHHPFTLPPGASCGSDDSDQCKFEHMVNRVDLNVGRIYDKLDTLGLLDNTLVLFTADNGNDHRTVSYLNGEAVYGDKHMPTDNGTRVPLIAHVPGQTAGRVVEDLIDITDILPTVADAAGIEVSADQALDGVSFWSSCRATRARRGSGSTPTTSPTLTRASSTVRNATRRSPMCEACGTSSTRQAICSMSPRTQRSSMP